MEEGKLSNCRKFARIYNKFSINLFQSLHTHSREAVAEIGKGGLLLHVFDWLVREVCKKKWNMKEGKIQMVSSQVGHSADSGNALGKIDGLLELLE